ncbi:MAG: lipoyl protein ligase domain-containing protein, partial [Opitutales bacterium]
MRPLILAPNRRADAAANMGTDAALLASLPPESAVFRHYGWTEAALTFGYSQKYEAVHALAPTGVTLCRRLTGGGIVDHRNDWTYALALETGLPAARRRADTLYGEVHRKIRDALQNAGVDCGLAPCPRDCNTEPAAAAGNPKKTVAADQCFLQAAHNDVVRPDGTKIAGAAMKRTRSGLLLQGSIAREALPPNFDFGNFRNAFAQSLAEILELRLTDEEREGESSILNKLDIQAEK